MLLLGIRPLERGNTHPPYFFLWDKRSWCYDILQPLNVVAVSLKLIFFLFIENNRTCIWVGLRLPTTCESVTNHNGKYQISRYLFCPCSYEKNGSKSHVGNLHFCLKRKEAQCSLYSFRCVQYLNVTSRWRHWTHQYFLMRTWSFMDTLGTISILSRRVVRPGHSRL